MNKNYKFFSFKSGQNLSMTIQKKEKQMSVI